MVVNNFLACVASTCQSAPMLWMAKLIICIVGKTKLLKVPFESTSWLKRLSPSLSPLLAALHSVCLACISQTRQTSNASAVTPVTATIFSLKNKKRGDALPTDKPTKLRDFRHACTEHSAHDVMLPSAPEQHSRGQLRICSRHRLSQEHHHDERKKRRKWSAHLREQLSVRNTQHR